MEGHRSAQRRCPEGPVRSEASRGEAQRGDAWRGDALAVAPARLVRLQQVMGWPRFPRASMRCAAMRCEAARGAAWRCGNGRHQPTRQPEAVCWVVMGLRCGAPVAVRREARRSEAGRGEAGRSDAAGLGLTPCGCPGHQPCSSLGAPFPLRFSSRSWRCAP